MKFKNKVALVTGITGQDGSYLAEYLLRMGYTVVGLRRRTSTPNLVNVPFPVIQAEGDITDPHSLDRVFGFYKPDEIYHLAAQTFVGTSWKQPKLTAEITGLGTLNMLEAMKKHVPDARFYQASSSEQFGKAKPRQNENTPFHPRSPYGVAKCYAHNITVNYRESYDLHASCGILFNHESPRRGLEFVTRKVTNAVAQIYMDKLDKLQMGSLHPVRDWGHARDYVKAMYLMLQEPEPDDYVIATGVGHTIEELLEVAFNAVHKDWRTYYEENAEFVRPAEVEYLLGDSSKAKDKLGWEPETTFQELIEEMVEYDLQEALKGDRTTSII